MPTRSRRRRRPAPAAVETPAKAHRRLHDPLIAGVLVALCLFVYMRVVDFGFVNRDDPTYVTENAVVKAGLSWANVWWAITTGHPPYWHPLTWVSHMLDVSLFGVDAGAHHAVNLVLHIFNTILVFVVFRSATRAGTLAAILAALFAVHPLHVESVAWITERKDLLSTFFLLLTMWAYVAYARDTKWPRYLLVVAMFALALMSKPMVVTLPVQLLLLDVWPLRRLEWSAPRRAWIARSIEKIPLLILSAATSVVTIVVQATVGAMSDLTMLPWSSRLATVVVGYVAYLGMTVWPAGLAAFYPVEQYSPPVLAGAACVLVATTAVAIAVRRSLPFVLVGWAWFFVGVLPVSGLLQAGEQSVADRFMYAPILGLLIVIVWGTDAIVRRRPAWVRIAAAGAALSIAVLALVARVQVETWASSLSLWEHAAKVTRPNYRVLERLGATVRDHGDLERARELYESALRVAPPQATAVQAELRNAIGITAVRRHDTTGAVTEFRRAVELDGALVEARINLGNSLAETGDLAGAEAQLREATRLDRGAIEARLGLGAVMLRQDRIAEAATAFQAAIAIDPNVAEAHNGLGGALMQVGEYEQAVELFGEAIRLKPDLPTAHLNMGLALVALGDINGARTQFDSALRLDPSLTAARQALRALDSLRR
ncbi:MAG TPA: tetratricopeptide repeat protein [Vicinamibacterales bacterium]|nr:tetratricopeptide repeat protein [Vicinamibacterales bacterium]